MLDIYEFISSHNDLTKEEYLGAAVAIAMYKTRNPDIYHPKLNIGEEYQGQLIKLIDAACYYDTKFSPSISSAVTLSHIINARQFTEEVQQQSLLKLITNSSIQGLESFIGSGFKPSSRNSEGLNVLQSLSITEDETNKFNVKAASMLIDTQKMIANLKKSREGIRDRTVEGQNIEGLEGYMGELLSFGLDKGIIKLSEFSPANTRNYSGFRSTIQNILDDKGRRSHLLEEYNQHTSPSSKKLQDLKKQIDDYILDVPISNMEAAQHPSSKPSTSSLRRRRVSSTSQDSCGQEEEYHPLLGDRSHSKIKPKNAGCTIM